MNFDINNINKVTVPKNTELNYRAEPSTTSAIKATGKVRLSYGRTTGNFVMKPDGKWWQVILNGTNGPSENYAWVRDDVTKLDNPTTSPVNDKTAQDVVNKLVQNDVEVYHSLVRSANVMLALQSKGVNTTAQKNLYTQLFDRYKKRQEKMKTSKVLQWKEGFKKGYETFVNKFKTFLKSAGIGELVSGTVVVISAILAGAALATTAYFAFKPSYDESKTDLKDSTDLEKALSTLEPKAAETVKKDLERQIDDAYNRGKTDGTFSGMFNIVKPLAIGAIGFFLITKFLDNNKKKSK